ncbi:MAG: hypothetical protein WEC75_04635 [Dehalococcoidia bacterium]
MLKSLTTIIIATFAAMALAACAGGDDTPEPTSAPRATSTQAPAPSPTPAPDPTAPAASGGCAGAEESCALAEQIATELLSGDLDAVVSRVRLRPYTCPGPEPEGLGGAYPLCEGAAAGDVREGLSHAHLQSEGGVISPDALRTTLEGWLSAADASASDSFSTGGPAFATVGCPMTAAGVDCTGAIGVVFTMIAAGGGRGLLELVIQRDADGPGITWLVTGIVTENLNNEIVSGGASDIQLTFGLDGVESTGTSYFRPDAGP